MDRQTALHFGVGLAVFSVVLMDLAANHLAAAVLAVSILFYVFVYTVWLKRRTAQNIVIGGAAGAFPPLIGWAAATGDVSALPLLLFAIIFLWTPPHFWALSLFVRSDYAAAGVPMLPVVAGVDSTRRHILLYTLPMAAAAIAPWPLGLTGWLYGVIAVGAERGLPGAGRSGRRQPGHRARADGAGEAAVRLLHPLSVRPVRGAGRRQMGAGMTPDLEPEDPQAAARAGAADGAPARRLRHPDVRHHHRQDEHQPVTALAQRNARTGLKMALLALAMVGLAFASVPLYRIFCQVTGFGGTTVRAADGAGRGGRRDRRALRRQYQPGLAVEVRAGAAGHGAASASGRWSITGRPTSPPGRPPAAPIFNVTPVQAGPFFSKIECFCFTEQTLKPGESVNMPVIFFVDPRVRDEEATRHIDEITLSYTFYPVESGKTTG